MFTSCCQTVPWNVDVLDWFWGFFLFQFITYLMPDTFVKILMTIVHGFFTSQSFLLCQPLNGRVLVRVQKLTKLRLLEPPGSDSCTVEGSLFSWCLDCPKEKDMGQMATFMTTVPTLVTSTNATARCLKVKSQLFPVKPRIAWHLLRMMIAKFTACFLWTASKTWNKTSLSMFSLRPHKICKLRGRMIAVRHL